MKTKITMLWIAVLALFTAMNLQAQTGDLVVRTVMIGRVDGNNIHISYSLQNIGTGNVDLRALSFQAFLSANEVYNANVDVLASGGLFPNAGVLVQHQQYHGSLIVSSPVNLGNYPFLIFEVKKRPGYPPQETNLANNTKVSGIHARFPDLAVTTVTGVEVDGYTVTVRYTLKNVGATPLHLSKFTNFGYVAQSASGLTGGVTIPGPESLPNAPAQLLSGATFTGYWTFTSPVSLQDYPYLHFYMRLKELEYQRSLQNDMFVLDLKPYFSDLIVKNIVIRDVHENAVTFDYTIKNIGASVLNLDRFYFKTYLSQSTGTSPLFGEPEAGSSVYGLNAIRVEPGQEYTGRFTSRADVLLQYHQNLIFLTFPFSNGPNPQVSHRNDPYAINFSSSFTDLVVSDININEVRSDSIRYSYSIRNGGADTLHLDRFQFVASMSEDAGPYTGVDQFVGGGALSSTPLILLPGQIITRTTSGPLRASLQTHPYLIFFAFVPSGQQQEPQQSLDNDRYIKYVSPALAPRVSAYHVEEKEDELTVEHVAKNAQPTSYVIYTTTGEIISEGSFEEKGQITTAGLTSGIYLIKLSDGTTIETVKFFVRN